MDCGEVQDLLPDRVHGTLPAEQVAAVDGHLARCEACSRELALVRRLFAAATPPPEGLAARLQAALRETWAGPVAEPSRRLARAPRGWTRAGWALAASVVIALGSALWMERTQGTTEVELWQAFLDDGGTPWLVDDGLVAGAPVISELTDEELVLLLEELGG